MTQALSWNPSSVLKRPLDQHHLGCINLGQSVLVPYQLSASSYATAYSMPKHLTYTCSYLPLRTVAILVAISCSEFVFIP